MLMIGTLLWLVVYATVQQENPNFSQTYTQAYVPNGHSKDPYTLHTVNNTFAVKILNENLNFTEIHDQLHVVFFYRGGVTAFYNTTVPVVPCSEFYSEQINTSDFFLNTFSDPEWLCPNINVIDIHNTQF